MELGSFRRYYQLMNTRPSSSTRNRAAATENKTGRSSGKLTGSQTRAKREAATLRQGRERIEATPDEADTSARTSLLGR